MSYTSEYANITFYSLIKTLLKKLKIIAFLFNVITDGGGLYNGTLGSEANMCQRSNLMFLDKEDKDPKITGTWTL